MRILEKGNVLDQTVTDIERFGAPVDDELAAGETSIQADLLLYGSEANDLDKRRCGLTLRYCGVGVRARLGRSFSARVAAIPARRLKKP